MMAAMMLFLSIGFGVAVGLKTGAAVFGPPPQADPVSLPLWTLWTALVLAPIGFIVLFQANPRDSGWIIAICALAFGCARLGSHALGIASGSFVGALAVGMASGVHSRWRNRPALVTATPGILMLVPGSVGFRSITTMLANDPVQGLQAAFTTILTAVAIVTGLLMARVLVPRRRWFK